MSMMKWAALAVAAVLLASCSSPEDRIRSSCIREGGFTNGSGAAPEVVDRQCTCFAKQLKAQLPEQQLDEVAKLLELPKDQRDQAVRTSLSMQTSTAFMSAAKSCALQ